MYFLIDLPLCFGLRAFSSNYSALKNSHNRVGYSKFVLRKLKKIIRR